MPSDDTLHFDLTSPEGAAEWSAIVPGSGLVYLGPQRAPFTISMLHQLKCLNVIRSILPHRNDSDVQGTLVQHCLNYLRQMIMCRADTHLESVQDPMTSKVDEFSVYRCRDWCAVYDAVAANQ